MTLRALPLALMLLEMPTADDPKKTMNCDLKVRPTVCK